MNNKLFFTLVVILSALIACVSVWFVISIIDYKNVTNLSGDVIESTSDDNEYEKKIVENNKATNNPHYILPSDSRELIRSELEKLNLDTLNKAYNEIFARHGHDFKNEELKEYFKAQEWYKAVPGKTVEVSELSALEYSNMSLIKTVVNELKNK